MPGLLRAARTALRALPVGVPLVALTLAGASSCASRTSEAPCEGAVRTCVSVCDIVCEDWGCFPLCTERCRDECPGAPTAVAGDAGVAARRGLLCDPCGSDLDCASGALCIQSGRAAEGGTFCGQPCTAGAGACPEGFLCAYVARARQCFPVDGFCR